MKYTLIIFILSCFILPANAQRAPRNTNGFSFVIDDVFKKLVDAGFLTYKKPKHYKQLDTIMQAYRCGDLKIPGGSMNTLVNADSSIIINVAQRYQPNLPRKVGVIYYDEERELNYVEHNANKQIFTPIIYTKLYSLAKFNADYSGMYARKCSPIVEPRFTNNKIIYFGKGGYSFHLYYIYTNEAAGKIDEEIKKTIGFLKFKS